jgi:hypothetical protein
MCDFLRDNWKDLLLFLLAGVGIWQYFDRRRRELAWKRTEFLFKQARLLDSDQDMSDAVQILEGRHPAIKLEDIFGSEENRTRREQSEYLHKFDKLLNLLDRVAYAVLQRGTLSVKEAANFGWYLERIAKQSALVEYCKREGFRDILELGREIDKEIAKQRAKKKRGK